MRCRWWVRVPTLPLTLRTPNGQEFIAATSRQLSGPPGNLMQIRREARDEESETAAESYPIVIRSYEPVLPTSMIDSNGSSRDLASVPADSEELVLVLVVLLFAVPPPAPARVALSSSEAFKELGSWRSSCSGTSSRCCGVRQGGRSSRWPIVCCWLRRVGCCRGRAGDRSLGE
jgi:hypothetical protein